mgnify:CR=1 FL=1
MIVQRNKKRPFSLRRLLLKLCTASIVLVGACWVSFPYSASKEELIANNGASSSGSSILSLPERIDQLQSTSSVVEERRASIERVPRIPGGDYPLLSSLIRAEPPPAVSLPTTTRLEHKKSDGEATSQQVSLRIVGDVQFLLDYAIVGFSKCGTTTLLKWIKRDPNVRTFKREIHEIINDNPGRLAERLYQNLLENPVQNNTSTSVAVGQTTTKNFLQGFKNPEILQVPQALRHLHNYWPETKLIVTVRNPLKWFRSFYNFRLTIGHLSQVGTDPNALIGSCNHGNKILCSHMGAFHVKLFRLGKSPMDSSEELDLLKPFLSTSDDQDIWDHFQSLSVNNKKENEKNRKLPHMKNKIFFLDLRQMSDGNRTRATRFRRDLQQFLGLEHELSPVFRARPFKQLELTLDEESKRHKIDSICNSKYAPLQEELFHVAQKASLWIRQYFLKSPDVMLSSPEYVEELLETWMHNPCDGYTQEQLGDGG